jgi:uncharacterized protein (TIGR03083 family)
MTSEQSTDQDYLEAYIAVRARLAPIVTAHCDTPVPACPGWRVHDVVAHLAGLCEDWVGRRLEGYATDAWTAHQVSRHRHQTCDEIVQQWGDALMSFARLERSDNAVPPARWAFGDAVVHEADVRGATACGRVPDDAVLLALRATMARWRHEVLATAGIGTLHVRTPEGTDWWLGTPNDTDALRVEAPLYEVFRALAGRRSEDQVGSWRWSTDCQPVIEAGLPFPFHWASGPLDD